MGRDDETNEEVRALVSDLEEIHEVICRVVAHHFQEVGQGGETDMPDLREELPTSVRQATTNGSG